jgi:hypothetical protein
VGTALRGSQTAAATTATTTKSLDDEIDSVKPVANLAEPASSGESPDLLTSSDALGHAFLFTSRSGIISDNVRSLATFLHAGTHPPSWEPELEYPTVAPHDLQTNREGPVFYLRSQPGSHPGLHLSHMNVRLAENPQPPLGIVTTPISHLTLPSPFQHGDAPSPSGSGVEVQPAPSPGPHTSPAAAAGLLQTRYSHLGLASESLSLAPAYTVLEHPPSDLGPPAAAHPHASVDLSVVPDLVALQPGQLPAVPSSVPVPSIYKLLFDMDNDSIDQPRDGNDVSSGSPPELPSGNAAAGIGMTATTLPHDLVSPTPVSFIAKWEDMLALEHRIRSELSSSHENNDAPNLPPQSKQVPEAQTQAQTQAPNQWKPTEQSETNESLLTRP